MAQSLLYFNIQYFFTITTHCKDPLMHKMNKRLLIVSSLTFFLFLQIGVVVAISSSENFILAATIPTQSQEGAANQEEQNPIYGVQLMTEQERAEFRSKMRAAKTLEEKELIRNENHKAMQERAESHGMVLPDQQPKNTDGNNQTGKMMDKGRGMDKGEGTRYGNQDGQ
jgi:hypothetical protein